VSTEETIAVRSALGTLFDKTVHSLRGRPDAIHTQAQTIQEHALLTELEQTFIVQTYRCKDAGDTVLLTFVSADGSFRVVLPPKVTAAIARQRDALSAKNRRLAARAEAARRKAAGVVPGFMKNGNGRGKRKKRAAGTEGGAS